MESTITENVVLRDWLTFTSKTLDPYQVVEALGLSKCNWTNIKGFYGYQDRLYFGNISIHYNGREDMGVCCEMSGQGCRNFEDLSTLPGKWDDLFQWIRVNDLHVTRYDVAYDDHTGVLDIGKVKDDVEQQNYISRFRSWKVTNSNKGLDVQIGSFKSDILVRIYDKAAERGYDDGRHWVRVEMQLRDDRAGAFLDLSEPLGEAFAGVLLNYLRFVSPSETDSNKRRWPTATYWDDLLGDVAKIRLYTAPGGEYNVERCKHYVVDMAGNAIAALIEVCGGIDEFEVLIDNRRCLPNPRYDMMLNEYRMRQKQAALEAAARRKRDDELFSERQYWISEMEGKQHESA